MTVARTRILLAALVLATALAACNTLTGIGDRPAPETVEEAVLYVDGTITALARTTVDLLDRGAISADQARRIVSELEEAAVISDAAKALASDDPEAAERRLALAEEVLLALERELQEAATDEP